MRRKTYKAYNYTHTQKKRFYFNANISEKAVLRIVTKGTSGDSYMVIVGCEH